VSIPTPQGKESKIRGKWEKRFVTQLKNVGGNGPVRQKNKMVLSARGVEEAKPLVKSGWEDCASHGKRSTRTKGMAQYL